MYNDFTIHCGTNPEALKQLADNSVDSVVTDPPYEFGFMGKSWDKSGIAYSVELWCEVLRVLKPGGHLLAFGGSRTYHRLACAIEDAGFEIRDQMQWIYGSGFPKSKNIGNGFGTALKPAHEPICVARKPLSEKTVAENVLRWGTGAINIDGCRIEGEAWKRPATGAEGYRHKSSDFRMLDIEKQSHSGGRFPANVIHDGSEEVLQNFPDTKAGGSLTGNEPSSVTAQIYGNFASGREAFESYNDEGSASRFFYCAKASKSERNAGLDDLPVKRPDTRSKSGMGTFDEKGVQPQRNHHPTVKPLELMQYLCRLITPPDGVVLDPFCGSGSTGKAAIIERFKFIGIDQEEEYCEIARKRLNLVQVKLF